MCVFLLCRAPELFEVPSECVITEKTDVWSLGCSLYAAAFGEHAEWSGDVRREGERGDRTGMEGRQDWNGRDRLEWKGGNLQW